MHEEHTMTRFQGTHEVPDRAYMESQSIPNSTSQGIHDSAYMELQGIHDSTYM